MDGLQDLRGSGGNRARLTRRARVPLGTRPASIGPGRDPSSRSLLPVLASAVAQDSQGSIPSHGRQPSRGAPRLDTEPDTQPLRARVNSGDGWGTPDSQARVPRSVAMKLPGQRTEAIYRRYAITSDADLRGAAKRLAHWGRGGNCVAEVR